MKTGNLSPGVMRIHGITTNTYHVWRGMRQRCENPKNPNYHNYGGRGNPRRGENHPMAAANDNLVQAIRDSELSGRKAAVHFGVSYGMVANIRSGRRWAHVQGEAA